MVDSFVKHRIVHYLFSKIPTSQLSELTHTYLLIAHYHMINDCEVMHTKHLYSHKTIKQFTADIDYLLDNFKPIHLEDLLAFTKKGHTLPPKALLLTFDDGFQEMYDIVAPILIQKGIPATFFINSGFTDNNTLCYQHKASLIVDHLLHRNISKAEQNTVEILLSKNTINGKSTIDRILAIKYAQRHLVNEIADILNIDFIDYLHKHGPYLSTEQIYKLFDKGFTFGAHSIDHPLYRDLTLEEQIRQTIESVSFVKNTFKLNYGAFAFPHSDYGVSKEYFNRIKQSGILDISFGTAGMIEDCVPNHFQRFSLEKPLMPAQNIISYQYARRLWRIINRNNVVKRTEV
jgi:peptidoglycan/xylan/chitin deacetylase (PgdA/CDA1 family)